MAFKKGQKVQTTVKVNARYTPGGKFRAVVRVGYPITITDTRVVGNVQHVKGARYWYATKDENGKVLIKLRAPASGGGSGTVGKIKSPCPGYSVSTPYGRRKAGLWRSKGYHTGDDYAAPLGADVVAVRDGTLRWRDDGVLGKCLLLFADNGRTYWYCHLSNRRVKSGAKVRAGQHIGDVGATGTGAQGSHLHFEDHKGHTTDWWASDRDPSW
jgi:murein DD-endopeptidase MepM/ murein hydrolase activator NlpD